MSYNLEWRGYDSMIRQTLRFNYVTAEGEKHMYVWALSRSSREQQPLAGLATAFSPSAYSTSPSPQPNLLSSHQVSRDH